MANEHQQYVDLNEEQLRVFEDEFADSFQQAFAENTRLFEDENVGSYLIQGRSRLYSQ